VDDYKQFNDTLLSALDDMAYVVVGRLKQMSGAAALDSLADISSSMLCSYL
jgi:hypothetical protein